MLVKCMKVVAVGDLSFKGEEKENTKKTFENIVSQNPDLVLALGDLTYKKTADPFMQATTNIGNEKIKPVIGNHDDDEKLDDDDAENFWNQIKEKYVIDKPYYSFIKENIFFIVLYTNRDFIADEEQKNFARDKLLEASSSPDVDWIIVCYHKPSVTSDTKGGHAPEVHFAENYHSLFDQFGVDLILTGHNHNYQRSKIVKHNPGHSTTPIPVEDGDGNYDTRKGRIFMVVGSGGRDKEKFEGTQEDYIKFRHHESHGILSMEFGTDKIMMGKFIANNGSVIDSFVIDKSGGIVEPPL